MEKIISFFLRKSKLNYTLFLFLVLFGIISYKNIPKEVFPKIKINEITVNGYYLGASLESLNKMAVVNLEKEFKSILGVQKISTYIKNGEFNIVLGLEKYSDKIEILNKVKTIISQNKVNLPSDMKEPSASLVNFTVPLIDLTIASNKLSKDKLIPIAHKIKNQLSSLENIGKIELYEDSTKTFEIILNDKKIEYYNLNKILLFDKIKQLSNIYPIGKIDDKNERLFLSTQNGKKKINEYLNTAIKIDNKIFYLKDIAKIKEKYKDVDVITKLNGYKNITIGISKNERANAIKLSKQIKEQVLLLNKQYKDITIETFYDTSIYIKNRLNTVISGILFGLILVTIALYLLINKRVAFTVLLGIPTAILLGVAVLSLTNYSINMISLIGALLVIGILVDDAVIIAENIQRHIMINENKLEAIIKGTKEVFTPVMASSLTTIFAFLPMLMLSGEIAEFLKLIPIAVVILISMSLVESFIFLPIHSLHILNKKDKELDWSIALNIYSKILKSIINHKKKFILIFSLCIPVLTFFIFDSMRYTLFANFDSNRIYIKGKFEENYTINETFNKAKEIENILLKNKKDLYIKNILFMSGVRTDNEDNLELKSNVFEFNIEFYEKAPSNFVEKYITPNLSFSYDNSERIRTIQINKLINKIKKLLKGFKSKALIDFSIKKESNDAKPNDIEILFNSNDKKLLLESIKNIKKKLSNIKGITFVDDTAKIGIRELKIKLNSYGESLGFNEVYISSVISNLFLKNLQTKGIYKNGIFEILTYSDKKNDFESFKNLEIQIPNSDKKVILKEICDFSYIKNFESITKVNTYETKKIIANVDLEIITSNEALKKIEKDLNKIREKGIKISFEGEKKENEKLLKELFFSFFVAIFLIFLTLIFLFNSFRQSFLILSIIPYSIIGALLGHLILDLDLSFSSLVGILGLAGVVVNDAIVMLDFINKSKTLEEVINKAKLRLRPIIITSITTFLGLSTLIFFATGQSKILQPIAVSLGFGLMWGTVLNLLYLPVLYAISYKIKK